MNKNATRVANYLADHRIYNRRRIHRSELVKVLNMKRSTVYDSLVRLEIAGVVRRWTPRSKERGKGRPKVCWQLKTEEF